MGNRAIIKGGRYSSRKLWFAIFTSFMIIIASKICQLPSLGEVISGLVATAGIYITGNVVTRWRTAQLQQAVAEPPKEPEDSKVKPEDDQRG